LRRARGARARPLRRGTARRHQDELRHLRLPGGAARLRRQGGAAPGPALPPRRRGRPPPARHPRGALLTNPDPAQAQPGEPMPQPDIDAFYRLAAARRDMRNGFRPDPVSDEGLTPPPPPAPPAPT